MVCELCCVVLCCVVLCVVLRFVVCLALRAWRGRVCVSSSTAEVFVANAAAHCHSRVLTLDRSGVPRGAVKLYGYISTYGSDQGPWEYSHDGDERSQLIKRQYLAVWPSAHDWILSLMQVPSLALTHTQRDRSCGLGVLPC